MINLQGELGAAERVVLAIDTSERARAEYLAQMARDSGALVVKEGLELLTAPGLGPEFCAANAAENNLDWVADAKLDDIPTTVARAVTNLVSLDHPPVAITIHTNSGIEAMQAAQEIAADKNIVMLGVTELTSKKEEELRRSYGFFLQKFEVAIGDSSMEFRKALVHMHARDADIAGIRGLVASARELRDPLGMDARFNSKVKMIPGTRSAGKDTHDQQNVGTPVKAIIDGATLLVIGRQITESKNPEAATQEVISEIQTGLDARRRT